MAVRFGGMCISVDPDKWGELFIEELLPEGMKNEFWRWLNREGTELKRSEGKLSYCTTLYKGQPLVLTISRVGGFSLDEVRQYQKSLRRPSGVTIGFTPFQASDAKIEAQLRQRASMSRSWDIFRA